LKLWATRDSLAPLLAFAQRQAKATPSPEVAANDGLLLDVLARFPDASAAEVIVPLLRDPVQRGKAVQVLLKFGPVAAGAVLPYLNHPDPDVRKEARRLCKPLGITEGQQIEQCLADITDSRKARSRTALDHLASLRVDEALRDKVSQALNAPLLDPDPGIREEAARALAVWVSRQNTDTLVKILASAQGEDQQARIDRVSLALIAIGPGVENAVIPLLQSPEYVVRNQACRVLAEVGTVASVKPLQEASQRYGVDRRFRDEALQAVDKIRARK
jgi:HEAT repeat protein